MAAFGQRKVQEPWQIKTPEYLVRPIDFKKIHQREGHDDYSGDVDGFHLDFDEKCTILIDIKYRRHYAGVLKPQAQKAYEFQANAATAGGQRTYVLIAGHDVDLHTDGAMVPIDRCQAIEVYYPESRVWHDHAQDQTDENGVPLDLSAPAVIQRLKLMGRDLDATAGERVRTGGRSPTELWETVMSGGTVEDACPPYLRKGITYCR